VILTYVAILLTIEGRHRSRERYDSLGLIDPRYVTSSKFGTQIAHCNIYLHFLKDVIFCFDCHSDWNALFRTQIKVKRNRLSKV
jgi:hypothetical protein